MIEKEILLLASIWNRSRCIIWARNPETAKRIFFDIKTFIPKYRQMILCGDIPKEVAYMSGARVVSNRDKNALKATFLQMIDEEEMGAPPIQIVFFQAGEEDLAGPLLYLDRGWMATTLCPRPILEKAGLDVCETVEVEGGEIHFLDAFPDDTFLESRIIEETKTCSRVVKEYVIQMKQSQVHLAFQAMRDELHTKDRITCASLLETFDIREKTLRKIMDIGKRDHRLDLTGYIQQTPAPIIAFLKELSPVNELFLAAVFDEDNLIGFAKYRDIVFPSRNFKAIFTAAAGPPDEVSPWGGPRFVELNLRDRKIIVYQNVLLYGFLLDGRTNPLLFKIAFEKAAAAAVRAKS